MNIKTTVLAFSIPASFAILTAQAPPAPTVDRVGFPANYQTTFTKLLTFDRPDNGQIRVIWANPVAAATPFWEPYPYGSVLLFESWTSKRDADKQYPARYRWPLYSQRPRRSLRQTQGARLWRRL